MFGGGKARFGRGAETACGRQEGLRYGNHVDAVDGAGGNAQAAAGAFVADDGVHQFGRSHNGIDRAGADAGGTADADGFVNQGYGFDLCFCRREVWLAQQVGNVFHDGFPTRRAQVDRRFSCRQGARIG